MGMRGLRNATRIGCVIGTVYSQRDACTVHVYSSYRGAHVVNTRVHRNAVGFEVALAFIPGVQVGCYLAHRPIAMVDGCVSQKPHAGMQCREASEPTSRTHRPCCIIVDRKRSDQLLTRLYNCC